MCSTSMAIRAAINSKINYFHTNTSSITVTLRFQNQKRRFCLQKPVRCSAPPQQQQQLAVEEATETGIACEACSDTGWLVCDFCNGQKTNVTAPNRRIYRRCPSCKAIGFVLCSKCKVYKCVTFPNSEDGLDVNF